MERLCCLLVAALRLFYPENPTVQIQLLSTEQYEILVANQVANNIRTNLLQY